ncbi:MAG: hypothetical protein QOJ09_2380 [Actinomycetota bacterium]|nr:hypothetical protein [Actinomycetota bacterium]
MSRGGGHAGPHVGPAPGEVTGEGGRRRLGVESGDDHRDLVGLTSAHDRVGQEVPNGLHDCSLGAGRPDESEAHRRT